MGDFSIRCDLSGVPIPCMAEVLVIEMGKSDRYAEYHYPLNMPIPGVMGSYGRVEELEYTEGSRPLHILPELYQAAAVIWEGAMFGKKVPKIEDEINKFRKQYKIDFVKYGNDGAFALGCVRDHGTHWFRRLKDVVLFAPDFGESNHVMAHFNKLITQETDPEPEAFKELQTFISVFMSSCITGVELKTGKKAHPFDQYPDLKVDLLWHQAVIKAIKNIQKKQR